MTTRIDWRIKTLRFRTLLIFALINTAISISIAGSNVPWQQISSDSTSLIFLLMAFPGHFFFYISLITGLVFLLSWFSKSSTRTSIVLMLLLSIFQGIIFVDAKIFELFRFHINSMVWNLMTGGESTQILSLSTTTLLGSGLGIFALAISQWVAWSASHYLAGKTVKHFNKITLLSLATLMISGQLFYAYQDASGYSPILTSAKYLPWPKRTTMKRFLRQQGVVMQTNTAANLMLNAETFSLNYPKQALNCSPQQAPNIIMIVVDSLRYDMLTQDIMPNTFNFSQQAQLFEDHISSGNATRFGLFGLLYGLPGSYWFPMLEQQRGSVFIDQLLEQNYLFYLYASASFSSPEFDRTIFSKVRNRLYDSANIKDHKKFDKKTLTQHRDTQLNIALLDDLDTKTKQPFFVFAFFDAPHNYSFDQSYRKKFNPSLDNVNYMALNKNYDATEFFNRYKNSINYVDQLIGKLINKLVEKRLLDNSIVIITSDHGQEFNENGLNYWGHNSAFSQIQIKVPFVLRWPGKPAQRYKHRTAHEDVVPTLLQEALGCDNSFADYSTGKSLYDPSERQRLVVSWTKRGILDRDKIYVYGGLDNGTTYDMSYSPLEEATVDTGVVMRALQQMSEFLN